jgi:hypothetical protein
MLRSSCFTITVIASASLAARTHAQMPAGIPKWRLTEDWRVGGDVDGPYSFDANHGLGLLPSGGLVHYDYKASKLFFLDSIGRSVRATGRKGGGPGEFDGANGFVIDSNGNVVVNDRFNTRFSRFRSNGDFAGVTLIAGSRYSDANDWDATFLRDGRLVETIGMLGAIPGRVSKTLLWSADLKRSQEIRQRDCIPVAGAFEAHYTEMRTAQGQLILYDKIPMSSPDRPTAIDPAGYIWEPLSFNSNQIVRRPIAGCTVLATVTLSGARVTVPPALVERAKESATELAKRLGAQPPVVPSWSSTFPWYDTLHVDKVGNLWVERTVGVGKSQVDIYSTAGVLLARLAGAVPVNMRGPIIITKDHLYGLQSDADGVRSLVALSIVR